MPSKTRATAHIEPIPHETTAFLPKPSRDPSPDDVTTAARTDNSSRQRSLALPAIYLTFFFLYVGQYMLPAPTTQVYETIICRRLHPDAFSSTSPSISTSASSSPCKSSDVQSELALIQAGERLLGALPTILAIPYSVLADRRGRQFVLSLSALGMLLEQIWGLAICTLALSPSNNSGGSGVSLRLVWFGPAFEAVGGGMAVASTMVHIVAADEVGAQRRSGVFFALHAATTVASMVAMGAGSVLMVRDVWVPWYLGIACTALSVLVSMVVPNRRREGEHGEHGDVVVDGDGEVERAGNMGVRERFGQAVKGLKGVGRIVRANPQVLLMLCVFFMSGLGQNVVTTVLLLYISKRFDWSFARANTVWFIGACVELVVLVGLLPLVTRLLTKRFGMSAHTKDRLFGQVLSFILCIGILGVGLLPSVSLIIPAFVIYSFGTGLGDVFRSLLTYKIDPKDISVVYSVVTILGVLGSSLAGPLYDGAFAAGLRLGTEWSGLPFMISSGLFALIFLLLPLVKERRGYEVIEEARDY